MRPCRRQPTASPPPGPRTDSIPRRPGHRAARGRVEDARIVVKGAHVEHWLNGTKVVEYELWSADWEAQVAASKFTQWPDVRPAPAGATSRCRTTATG